MKQRIKKLLPRTLFGRSLMILITPILLVQMVTAYVFVNTHWQKMTDRLAFAVVGEIAVVANQIEADNSPENIHKVVGWAGQNLELLVSYDVEGVLDESAKASASGFHGSEVSKILGRSIEAQIRRPYRINLDAREKWVEVSLQLEDGLLHISLPERRLFSSSIYLLLRWMIASSIVLLIVAILFMRNQIRPIRKLAVVAERFGKGLDMPSSFKPEGAREVRQAGRAFMDMQQRIKRQVQQRTAMLAGVSHDLRTPLTRMKLQAAMLGNNPDVEALKSDIADMERMIDAYLDFARGEGGEPSSRGDIKEMLERIVSAVKRQGVKVELTTQGDLSLQMRPVAIERSLNNIINNARKYGKDIWIKAQQIDDYIEITVEDNGPGVEDSKKEDVFRPFYRVDESRNSSTGGVGLGLPIAQDIIHSHGGNIVLEDSEHGGLRVVIRIPV